MKYPRIYLAIDNCFASKRWTEPKDWMLLIRDLGLKYVEASADNEIDPLYAGSEFLKDWIDKVRESEIKTGVRVANLYSGHGTYATLGLAHTDLRIRERFLNGWLKQMVKVAISLDAGLGFFCHAFSDAVLQDRNRYIEAKEDLYNRLAELTVYSHINGMKEIGVEQMYTPHQIPWTIEGSKEFLRDIYERNKIPCYITIDTGHQSGQRKFIRPGYGKIKEMIRKCKDGKRIENFWLGPKSAYKIFQNIIHKTGAEQDKGIKELEQEMSLYPYLFARYEDGDEYIWLEQLGCYSPIIHLQQTCGYSSSHLPFTEEFNRQGIIFADKVLKTLAYSYERDEEDGMPPKCKDIYLTIEVFSGTADLNIDIINNLIETVKYWRQYIPLDGLTLDNLVKKYCHNM